MHYKQQLGSIEKSTILENIPRDAVGIVLSNFINESKFDKFLHIATGNFQSRNLKKVVEFFSPNTKVLLLENWDNLPYDRISPKNIIQSKRIKTLDEILNHKKNKNRKLLVITTIFAALQRTIPKKELVKSCARFNVGMKISVTEIEDFLASNGYRKVNTAISTGEFAVNGNILDAVTSSKKCFRIVFLGNILKEIKKFNPVTQISSGSLQKINILPVSEVIFSKINILNFKQNYKRLFGIPKKNDLLYKAISSSQLYSGAEHYLPLFYNDNLSTIFDYLDKDFTVSLDEAIKKKMCERIKSVKEYYQQRLDNVKKSLKNGSIYQPIPTGLMYLTKKEFNDCLAKFINVKLCQSESKNKEDRAMDLKISSIPEFYTESKSNKTNAFMDLQRFLEKLVSKDI